MYSYLNRGTIGYHPAVFYIDEIPPYQTTKKCMTSFSNSNEGLFKTKITMTIFNKKNQSPENNYQQPIPKMMFEGFSIQSISQLELEQQIPTEIIIVPFSIKDQFEFMQKESLQRNADIRSWNTNQ